MRYLPLFLLFFCLPVLSVGQTAKTDSVCRVIAEEHFRPKQLILPGALLAVGALGVENGWLGSVDRKVNEGISDLSGGHHIGLDDYLRFAPLVGSVVLSQAGVSTPYSLEERLAVRATSFMAYFALVGGLKQVVHETRPDGSDRKSFPSGHTTVAFMGAEHIRTEYGGWYGVGAYTVACGVAFLRLYNQKHWLNDVVAGAGTGILCARLGYWLLPYERKLFKLKTKNDGSSFVALPTFDASRNAVGCAMAYQF